MKTRNITRRRLEWLLENWGAWEANTNLGPAVSPLCGSAERAYASDTSRYVWDGRSTVPRETTDDPLIAQKTEAALLRLPEKQKKIIVLRYARQMRPESMAQFMRMSVVSVDALLDAAIVSIWSELEGMSWASGI